MRELLEQTLIVLKAEAQKRLLDSHILLGRIEMCEDLLRALPVEPKSTGDNSKEENSVEL